MANKIKTIGLMLFMIIGHVTYGQTDKDKALEKAKTAIQLMDNGKIDESIKLLKEAQELDPDRFDYSYEIAYAHYLKQDYNGAIKILKKNKDHKNVTDQLFQLLGNSYDMIGKTDKAFKAYDAGLEKFPSSAIIYLEKGNVYWTKEEYGNALEYYEKGILVDPSFPSNYYRAAIIYCSSTEEVWGMIYGEIFMNLERGSERTAEISKLLYDTYKSQIKFTSDTSFSVSFSKNAAVKPLDLNNPGKMKLPFGIGVYERVLMKSMIAEKTIDLTSLDRIRKNFVEIYFKEGFERKYPNILFDYQNKVLQAGHLEAYNHWILLKGDEQAFEAWHTSNSQKWDDFIKWFTENGLEVNDSNNFYSGQY